MDKRYSVFIAILVMLLITGSVSAMNGLAYLKIPNGARETAMGETGVSHARGGAAGWWNPALLAVNDSEVEFQIFQWLADGSGSFGGASIQTDWGGYGAYYFNLGLDGFEVRDHPGESEGTFALHQIAIAGGAAVNLGYGLSFGATYKTFTEDIYGDRRSGYNVFDAGLHYEKGDSWSAGTVITNLGPSDAAADPLPLTIRSGLSYERKYGDFGILVTGEGTAVMRDDDDPTLHFGIEADWIEQFYLRGGFISGYDTHSWTTGVGIVYNRIRADISVTPYDDPLGSVWRLGMGLRF